MDVEQSGGADLDQSGALDSGNVQTPKEPPRPSEDASKSDWTKWKRDMLKYKDEVEDLREKIKSYELREEEQKGDLQKVINRLKEENGDLKKKYSQDRFKYAFSKVEDSIKMEAAKLGCKDPDTFFRLIDQAEIKAIEVDDSFNASKKDVQEIVSSNLKKYEHLGFFDKKVNVIDRPPKSGAPEGEKSKPVDQMSKDELLAYAKKHGFKTLK